MTMIKVPTEPTPFFDQELSLNGIRFYTQFRWNEANEAWYMRIKSLDESVPVDIQNIKLIVGQSLVKFRAIEEFIGDLYMVDMSGNRSDPTFDSFSSDGFYQLIYNSEA